MPSECRGAKPRRFPEHIQIFFKPGNQAIPAVQFITIPSSIQAIIQSKRGQPFLEQEFQSKCPASRSKQELKPFQPLHQEFESKAAIQPLEPVLLEINAICPQKQLLFEKTLPTQLLHAFPTQLLHFQ